jgi:hypothetical protein
MEGAVGDVAQPGADVVQGADMAPVDLVGMGFEMVGAVNGQPFQQGIDLCLGGEEGVKCRGGIGHVVGHPDGSVVAVHRVSGMTFAPVEKRIN